MPYRHQIQRLTALGIGLQTLALTAWCIAVIYSGVSGEQVVTRDGSEVTLGLVGLIIALVLGVITWTVWKGYRWSTGPAITLEVLFIGGAVMSGDFLSLGQQIGLVTYGVILTALLLMLRIDQDHDRHQEAE